MTRQSVVLAAAGLLAASPAMAATICVNPAGGPCQTTIQAGVNLAAAGDVVKIAAGVYPENVLVPAGKDGLQILGASKITTIVDPDLPLGGSGITVQSADVVVKNLAIRNGAQYGIVIFGNNAVVQGTRVVGVRGAYGIAVAGGVTGVQILANDVRSIGNIGIYMVSGNDGAVVKGNLVSQVPIGIGIGGGTDVQIVSNKVTGATTGVILATGATPLVATNLIENVVNQGLSVTAIDPVVQSNRLTSAGSGLVNCTACTAGRATGNSSLGSVTFGFQFQASAPGFTAQSNRVAAAQNIAFVVGGTGLTLLQNTATDTGTFTAEAAFAVFGPSHTLDRNMATRVAGSGFYLAEDNLVATGNVVTGAGASGFVVDGNGGAFVNNTLTGNKAYSANGGGISLLNGPTGYTITGNTATKNRVDFCGAAVVPAGNAFGTTTTTCDILN